MLRGVVTENSLSFNYPCTSIDSQEQFVSPLLSICESKKQRSIFVLDRSNIVVRLCMQPYRTQVWVWHGNSMQCSLFGVCIHSISMASYNEPSNQTCWECSIRIFEA